MVASTPTRRLTGEWVGMRAAGGGADSVPAARAALAGLSLLDGLLHHVSTPQFIVPQLLNLSGSVLFAYTLGVAPLALVSTVANGEGGQSRQRSQQRSKHVAHTYLHRAACLVQG